MAILWMSMHGLHGYSCMDTRASHSRLPGRLTRDNGIPGHDNTPVRASRAGIEICIKIYFLDQNQTAHLTIFFCTRPTDPQKIDFLKIYISRFFQAKTSPGTPQNTPRSSPNDPQNLPKSIQNRPKIDPC